MKHIYEKDYIIKCFEKQQQNIENVDMPTKERTNKTSQYNFYRPKIRSKSSYR